MPTDDVLTMTTFDLLRELEQRGGLPASYELVTYPACIRFEAPNLTPVGVTLHGGGFGWLEPDASRFTLDLQLHLAVKGVTVAAVDGQWCYAVMCLKSAYVCRPAKHGPRSITVPEAAFWQCGPVTDPDSILRAAVLVMREVQDA